MTSYASVLRGMPGTQSGVAPARDAPVLPGAPEFTVPLALNMAQDLRDPLRHVREMGPMDIAALIAGPAGGPALRTLSAHPKMSAALLGLLGAPLAASDAGDPAPQLTKRQRRQIEMDRQKLEAETAAERARIEAETQAARQRGTDEAEIERKRQEQESALAEYERQIKTAEKARDFELARKRRFSDTPVGGIMEGLGGAAPAVAGIITGLVTRGAGSGRVLPFVTGSAFGTGAANVPLAYDALYTDPDNPEKAAYSAYAREAPAKDPKKKEYADYAATLPAKNQVRELASEELYDPVKFAERAGLGVLEGGGGGIFGSEVAQIVKNLMGPLLRRGGAQATQAQSAAPAAPARVGHWERQSRDELGRFGPMGD